MEGKNVVKVKTGIELKVLIPMIFDIRNVVYSKLDSGNAYV